MGLLKYAALGAVGYYFLKRKREEPAAFAAGQPQADAGSVPPVRDAGASAMRDRPDRWSKIDEELDETFPASDAPANY